MTTKKIQRCDSLLLVSSGCSPSSCSLELASLGPDEGLGIRVGNTRSSEMSDSLTCLSWSLKEQSVLASWSSQGKLIKSDNLTKNIRLLKPRVIRSPRTRLKTEAQKSASLPTNTDSIIEIRDRNFPCQCCELCGLILAEAGRSEQNI